MTVEAYPVHVVPHSQSGRECGSHHPTVRKMRRSLPGQLENQFKAQWGIDSLIAIGSMNRGDQTWDCEDSRTKAQRFGDAATGCELPPTPGGAATRPLACLGC